MRTECSLEQQPHQGVLRKTTTKITPFTAATFQSEEGTYHNDNDDHILVHFNGQTNDQPNGTMILPDTAYEKSTWGSDAQIAARRAMAKRSSRSYAARISRQKSRRRDMLGRQTKPGITVDTSFSSHHGNVPHQLYPHEGDLRHNRSIKKPGWFGLGRTSMKNKGLGITEGTPRTDIQATPDPRTHRPNRSVDCAEPKTADSLTSGSKTWQEISPWDRPIPIGISIPSDSVTDFSLYQGNRQRSGSNSTLVTPSIIITPAAAMKSVWSPDTDSDYTGTPGRASSIYSRATFMPPGATPEVPPVPALPTGLSNWSNARTQDPPTRGRKDTLDSAGTAFEEEEEDDDYDMKQKGRVMSSGTVFEEDDIPLRDRQIQSTLSIDTSMVPTPRRSQGWWNVITTPFMISRSNSVWTQNARQDKKTPDVPTIPAQFGTNGASISSPSTYIWSATEKSPSTNGDSPVAPASLSTAITTPEMVEQQRSCQVTQGDKADPLFHGAEFTNVQFNNFTVHDESRNQQPPTKSLDGSMNIVFNNFDFDKEPWDSPQQQPLPSKGQDTYTHIHFNDHLFYKDETHDLSEQRGKSPEEFRNVQFNNIVFGKGSCNSLQRPQSKSPDEFTQIQFNNFVLDKQTEKWPQPRPRSPGNMKSAQLNHSALSREAPDTTEQRPKSPDHNIASPLSAPSASPVVGTAAMGTVLMPRQVEEPSRPINITIELHDRRVDAQNQTVAPNSSPEVQQARTTPPAPQIYALGMSSQRANGSQQDLPIFAPPPFPQSSTKNKNTSQQELPVFAPPPTSAQNTSKHKSKSTVQQGLPVFAPPPTTSSRASTPSSTPDLRKPPKKHRKVSPITDLLPCGKRKREDKDDKKNKRRSWCFWCCGCCIIILILLAIIIPLTVVLTKKNNNGGKVAETQPNGPSGLEGEEPSQWLNLTGYPPIPTGVSTIAQPEAVEEESGCVAPTTLWSCALPKELHNSVSPNKPDQPNFKLDIVFDNSTESKPSRTRRATNPVSAGAFIRARLLNIRAAPSPSPAPPGDEDMILLGKTTDKNEAPFEGEDTPFFISLRDTNKAASRFAKRADDPTNITSVIPPPMLNSDGTAAPANLYPFPSAQPLRLFNRGKDNEHYGFYTYFDRSIFLKDITMGNGRGGNPADKDGGSAFDAASMRCTFSQTRFLVQIWTRSQATKPLLQSSAQADSQAFKRPGSFPYPVTVTMDRHGGDVSKKNLYCYEMESDGTIKNEASKRSFQFEDRGFGGKLVNGTQGRPKVTGPIDGGSGGCSCQWQNWLA